jgi:hypothetical protein
MKNNILLRGVKNFEIGLVWPYVSVFLEKALRYSDGKYNLDDIYNALCLRDMQLWLGFDDGKLVAVCVTQIVTFPRKKILFLLLASGINFKKWQHLTHDMVAFAKENNCDAVELYGRPGWEKMGKDVGFKKISTIYKVDMR